MSQLTIAVAVRNLGEQLGAAEQASGCSGLDPSLHAQGYVGRVTIIVVAR